jgi:hemerythrin-like domain-containing protein
LSHREPYWFFDPAQCLPIGFANIVFTHPEVFMKTVSQANQFKALDACHLQIQTHLTELTALVPQFESASDTALLRQQIAAIENFFSSTSRQHHIDEELNVFPPLLASDNPELVQTVRTLQQDHGWIEQNWLELSPLLRAIAQGEDWGDLAELEHAIDVFLTLCQSHIALEEALAYPQAKHLLAQELAARAKRLAQ